MDPRKDPTFLFCELGLCSKDNGAKKRTHSNLQEKRSRCLIRVATPSPLQPPGPKGEVMPWTRGKNYPFCFASSALVRA